MVSQLHRGFAESRPLFIYINQLTLLSEVAESSNLKESGNITNDLLPSAVGGVGSSDHPEAQLSPPVH